MEKAIKVQTIESSEKDFRFFSKLIINKNPNADINLIRKAYDLAKEAHKGKKRKSGESYFSHPIRVSINLLENNIADSATICSALLHDVVEDTEYSEEDLKKEFGEEIAEIVRGLTKLNKDRFKEGANFDFDKYNSENIRKMILAFAKDIRILFIKISDRLDNMRTLDVFREDKKLRIAKQTLKVYSPLAEKLGLYTIKGELEDLCLLALKPNIVKFLSKNIQLTKEQREVRTKSIMQTFRAMLKEKKIKANVLGRAKHFYSIFKKMSEENKSIDTIYDIYGIRIICDTVEECYEIQHMILDRWEIQKDKLTGEDRIKDYIKNPKPNGYQSIHMNFKYEESVVEVQIRTKEMDNFAESGVAKHWKYKKNERDKKIDKKIDWIRQIVSWRSDPKHRHAIETLKFDVFKDEIICVTPKGDLLILKEGSTPLDFAYAIHSKIGNHYEKSYVNNEPALINQKLKSGDIVNIVNSQKPMVSKQWLGIVNTNQAKTKIRQALGMTGKESRPPSKKEQLQYEDFGLEKRIEVIGKNAPTKLSKCCNPKYGDEIVGYYTKDRKVTVHKKDCPDRFAINQKSEVKIRWSKDNQNETIILINARDDPGLLGQVLDTFIKEGCYVLSIESKERKKNLGIIVNLKKREPEKIQIALRKIQALDPVIDTQLES